jgi:hypothetical protein
MAYPPYTVTIVAPDGAPGGVTIDGSHTLQVAVTGATLKLEFSHKNEGEDKVPSLILRVTNV